MRTANGFATIDHEPGCAVKRHSFLPPSCTGLCGFALAALAGSCAIHLLPAVPNVWPWGWVLILTALPAIRWRCIPALGVCAGLAWTWWNVAACLSRDLPIELQGQELEIEGTIASLVQITPTGLRFRFQVHKLNRAQVSQPALRNTTLELSWYDATAHPAAGEHWQLEVRLQRRHGFANEGGFDYERQLFANGVNATGYVRESAGNRRISAPEWTAVALRTRAWFAAHLAQALPDSAMLGIVQGLAVGDTQLMTRDQWRILAATGITHLMAISGPHISMVAMLGAWLMGCAVKRLGAKQARLSVVDGRVAGGITGAVGYSILAGLSIPSQRTLAMLTVYFLAQLLRRVVSSADLYGLALLAVLLLDPGAPLAPGMWLSFGAVAVILLVMSCRAGREGKLLEFSRVQIAVTIGLLPLLLLNFGNFSLVSPLVNAVAIPLFTVAIVPTVLAGTLLLPLSMTWGAALLAVPAYLLSTVWPALEWAGSLSWATWYFAQPPLWTLSLLSLGTVLVIAPSIWPLRMAGFILCIPAINWTPEPPRAGDYRVTVLDVGQGLSVVVQTRAHVLVYDTGPAFRSGRDTGELVVLPFLRANALREIDRVVVSHGDADHAGGLQSILSAGRVKDVLLGPSVKSPRQSASRCEAGQHWRWDGVEFSVLNPSPQLRPFDNDSSCVLRIAGAGGSTVLTGDIESRAERELVAGALQPAQIVIAPHHGSRTSSSAALVDALRARYVVFATGYLNHWGFPKPEIVQRWRAAGATPYDTASAGAIAFEVNAAGIKAPTEYRRAHPHYWSAH